MQAIAAAMYIDLENLPKSVDFDLLMNHAGVMAHRGITDAMKPFRWWTNTRRRFKRKIGYESEAGRVFRNGLPRPGGMIPALVAAARSSRSAA